MIRIKLAGLLSLGLVLGACGGSSVGKDGDVVGGPCQEGGCAAGSQCLDTGDFPGGTCSIKCTSDDICPDGTHCIDKLDGVCLLECESTDDCRDEYKCEERDRFKAEGQRKVCIES